MSISEFNVKEQWIGTADTSDYTFDFTIQDELHLLIYMQDDTGAIVDGYPVRGDDTTVLTGVIFDAVAGGGTISLVDDLPDSYVLTALMANDAPTQASEFKGKGSFTLSNIELALDFLACQIQRLAYLTQRSVKLSDVDDSDVFDSSLPAGAVDEAGATIVINADGDGYDFGATLTQIADASTYAAQALASQVAALASQVAAAASATAAAASAAAASASITLYGTQGSPLGITAAGGIANNIPGEQGSFIHGSPGAVTVSANPQIAAGTVVGQKMTLIGCDDTNTVTLTNGNGLRLNGDAVIGDGYVMSFMWDGANWQELYRSF